MIYFSLQDFYLAGTRNKKQKLGYMGSVVAPSPYKNIYVWALLTAHLRDKGSGQSIITNQHVNKWMFQYANLQSILYVCLTQFKNEYKNNRDIHTLTWMLLQSFITFIDKLHTGPTPHLQFHRLDSVRTQNCTHLWTNWHNSFNFYCLRIQ